MNPIVRLLVLILILIVRGEIFQWKNEFVVSLDVSHGPRTASINNRHVGDLGNVTADAEGTVSLDFEDWIIQLYNETQSIVDRAVVIHDFRDDGGEGGFNDSKTTGYVFDIIRKDSISSSNRNAGARIICGLIKLVWPEPMTTIETPTMATDESSATAYINSSTFEPFTGTSESSTTTSQSFTTTTSTTSEGTTTSTGEPTTLPSTGINIQPVMFVLIIAMIINYILRY